MENGCHKFQERKLAYSNAFLCPICNGLSCIELTFICGFFYVSIKSLRSHSLFFRFKQLIGLTVLPPLLSVSN